MIVVLEGVDGGGKTTLAGKLGLSLGLSYIHVSNPEPGDDVFQHHFQPIKGIKDDTIVDRLHWSDDVYGAVLRGGPGLSDQEFGFLDGYLASRGAITVLCAPPLETVLFNLATAPREKNHNAKTATRVWEEYQKPSRSFLTVLIYDYTQDTGAAGIINSLALAGRHFAKHGMSSL